MKRAKLWTCVALICSTCVPLSESALPVQGHGDQVLLEVVRKSWSIERKESLVYLRVYANGRAEAHPMRDVDFRHIRLREKQIPNDQLSALREMLNEPATAGLSTEYDRYWGNKDFGDEYDLTISREGKSQTIVLENFQPFLASKRGKPYPKQLVKLFCFIWKLRLEDSGEPLEKNWLQGCSGLGY